MTKLTHYKRARRIRSKLKKVNTDRLRLTVYRSSKNISAQIIDDSKSKTLVSASSMKDKGDTKFREFEQKQGLDKYKYKILYLNRNIRRKSPGDVALAYKHMMDKLTPEQRKE